MQRRYTYLPKVVIRATYKMRLFGTLLAALLYNSNAFFSNFKDEALEWCWAVPEEGKKEWDYCRPINEMSIEYHVTVVGVVGGGNDPK